MAHDISPVTSKIQNRGTVIHGWGCRVNGQSRMALPDYSWINERRSVVMHHGLIVRHMGNVASAQPANVVDAVAFADN